MLIYLALAVPKAIIHIVNEDVLFIRQKTCKEPNLLVVNVAYMRKWERARPVRPYRIDLPHVEVWTVGSLIRWRAHGLCSDWFWLASTITPPVKDALTTNAAKPPHFLQWKRMNEFRLKRTFSMVLKFIEKELGESYDVLWLRSQRLPC